MVTDDSLNFPGVFYVRNRILIIVVSIIIIIWSLLEFFQVFTTKSPQALSFVWIVIWGYMLLMALRRRLAISQEGLAYTGDFSYLRAKWSEVKYIENRRSLANLFSTGEGLVIRTDLPDAKEHFVDLQQFGRNWRQEALGEVLRMKAPQLFPSHFSR